VKKIGSSLIVLACFFACCCKGFADEDRKIKLVVSPAAIHKKLVQKEQYVEGTLFLTVKPKVSYSQEGLRVELEVESDSTTKGGGIFGRMFLVHMHLEVQNPITEMILETDKDHRQSKKDGLSATFSLPHEEMDSVRVWPLTVKAGFFEQKSDFNFKIITGRNTEELAKAILKDIKMEAQNRAQTKIRSVKDTKFLESLSLNFLSKYFASPTEENAQEVIKNIGADYDYKQLDEKGLFKNEYVCAVLGLFNEDIERYNATLERIKLKDGITLHIPESIRKRYKDELPECLYVPSTFLTGGCNNKLLPKIDTEFLVGSFEEWYREELEKKDILLGGGGSGEALEDDIKVGGANWSQPLHWATGVKYSYLPAEALHELFIGYELRHLEGWDVFGEDAINDLIAEKQGQLFGIRLRNCEFKTEKDLIDKFDEDFRQARAWTGALLRLKMEKGELNKMILQEEPPQRFHWYEEKKPAEETAPWGKYSITQLLKKEGLGMALDLQIERLIQIYTLKYEADNWEKKNGPIQINNFVKKAINGDYNEHFINAPKFWGAEWDIPVNDDSTESKSE
jgi:hypothetical protein